MINPNLRKKLDDCPLVGVEQDHVVAKAVGCSKTSVYRYRHQFGIKPSPKVYYPPRKRPETTFTPTPISEVAQLLERWRA